MLMNYWKNILFFLNPFFFFGTLFSISIVPLQNTKDLCCELLRDEGGTFVGGLCFKVLRVWQQDMAAFWPKSFSHKSSRGRRLFSGWFGPFLNDTTFILNSVSTVKLQHVKREVNEVAHRLARHGLTVDLRSHPI